MRKRLIPVCCILALGLACRERGRPDPAVHMAPSHDVEQAAGAEQGQQGQQGGQQTPNRVEIPPEVQEAYSGVRIQWKDSQSGKEGLLDVPLGGSARIPGSSVEVQGEIYLPAFAMSASTITSSGIEEQNPAARIGVTEDGKEIFGGWIFTRFPDVHPFDHPRFTLRLAGGIRKAPAKTKK
jgi:Uncharacterized protein conserved in bacteria (DUF2155)